MALEGDLVQLDRNAGRRSQRHALLLVEVQVDDFQRLKVFPYGVGHAAQLLSLHAVGAVVVRLVGAHRGQHEQLEIRLHFRIYYRVCTAEINTREFEPS